jgi:FkbM family methyltransferase
VTTIRRAGDAVPRQPLTAAPSAQFRRKPLMERAGERLREAPLAPWARKWARQMYHTALMWQSGGRGFPATLPLGEVIHVLPAYRYLSWNLLEYAAFREAVRTGGTALDVGANVGAYALLLGQWVGAAGAVYAFEPAPDMFDGLDRHIRLNNLVQVVHPIAAAVGDRDATADLLMSATAGEARLAAAGDRGGPAVAVPTVTIDTFCATHRIVPDFIKIDVEGWELAALRGARETLRGGNPSLFVELHPSIWPQVGVTRHDLLEELDQQRLEAVPLGAGVDPWSTEGVAVRLRRRP